jgi:hypothetical protein
MRFSDDDACTDCSLADQPEMAPSLRQKALFCMWLSTQTKDAYFRAALEGLSLSLMDEARAVEKECAIPAAKN